MNILNTLDKQSASINHLYSMIENTDPTSHAWLLGFVHLTPEALNTEKHELDVLNNVWQNFYNEHCANLGIQGFIRMKPSKPRPSEIAKYDSHVLQTVLLVPIYSLDSISESLETAFDNRFRSITLKPKTHPKTENYLKGHLSGPHWEIANTGGLGRNTQSRTQAHLHTSL